MVEISRSPVEFPCRRRRSGALTEVPCLRRHNVSRTVYEQHLTIFTDGIWLGQSPLCGAQCSLAYNELFMSAGQRGCYAPSCHHFYSVWTNKLSLKSSGRCFILWLERVNVVICVSIFKPGRTRGKLTVIDVLQRSPAAVLHADPQLLSTEEETVTRLGITAYMVIIRHAHWGR